MLMQHDYQRIKQVTAVQAKILDRVHLLDNLLLTIILKIEGFLSYPYDSHPDPSTYFRCALLALELLSHNISL